MIKGPRYMRRRGGLEYIADTYRWLSEELQGERIKRTLARSVEKVRKDLGGEKNPWGGWCGVRELVWGTKRRGGGGKDTSLVTPKPHITQKEVKYFSQRDS